MKIIRITKMAIVAIALISGLFVFWFTRKSEMQTMNPVKTPEKITDAVGEVAGYNKWIKVNDKAQVMDYLVGSACQGRFDPNQDYPETKSDSKNPHSGKYINVYVNSTGQDEMLTKKYPKFPQGTIVVKEKLSSPDSKTPELLTVMIKREEAYNAEVGDWEFLTFNGQATKVTSRGKLENCQACHLGYPSQDFVTRTALHKNHDQSAFFLIGTTKIHENTRNVVVFLALFRVD